MRRFCLLTSKALDTYLTAAYWVYNFEKFILENIIINIMVKQIIIIFKQVHVKLVVN